MGMAAFGVTTYVLPTPRERELLAAYIQESDVTKAAARVGLTYGSFSVALVRAGRRCGLTTVQMVYFGALDGWLVLNKPAHKVTPVRPNAVAADG